MGDTQFLRELILHHWHILVAGWLVYFAVGAMPSPNGGGKTGSLWYKWFFGFTHSAIGAIPRVMATFLPSNPIVQKVLNTQGYPTVPPDDKARAAGLGL